MGVERQGVGKQFILEYVIRHMRKNLVVVPKKNVKSRGKSIFDNQIRHR